MLTCEVIKLWNLLILLAGSHQYGLVVPTFASVVNVPMLLLAQNRDQREWAEYDTRSTEED